MTMIERLSHDLESLVARATPAVVSVEVRAGAGSGVVIAPDGYILTNAHVVGRASGARVGFADGAEGRAAVVGRDARTDLAVLRVDQGGLTALPLASGRELRVGELVVAIGNPLRLDRSVSLGVVSAIDRTLPAGPGNLLEGLVQTDAAINPGNSGGPLLDASGCVAGINTAIIPYAHGIGFAVSARTATWVAAVLIRKGEVRRPVLGITANGLDLPPLAAAEAGQRRAIQVHLVHPGSLAQSSGLRGRDLVISANGAPVASIDDLQRALVLCEGESVTLRVLRDHAVKELRLRAAA